MQLRSEQIIKVYKDRMVVKGVDIHVRSGEIVGLLGPNGAGKTTSFYMMVGFIRPTSGHVFIDDNDVTALPMYERARHGLGYLAQEPTLFKGLTVEENLLAVLERICDESCKLFILSNPHNPAGLVWDKDTLQKLARFCHAHNILVISDEIHSDMTLYGHKHIPFASVCPEAAEISITFGAPSKTFNIPGVVSSYAVVPDAELREKFFGWLEASELAAPGLFPPIATIAAYRNGEEWRRQMLEYVQGNVDYVADFCAAHLNGIKALRPQASFLVWLDCRGLKLSHSELVDLFVNKARLALNDGEMFGPGGQGFMRLNVALPRQVLAEALERLKAVL